MPPLPAATVRPSSLDDLATIVDIYGWHVQHGTGTFETEIPSLPEIQQRRDNVLANGWPWLVVEVGDEVQGFAYANTFRPRGAYRFCVEDSIYIDRKAVGKGLGRWLLAELIAQCEARGARQMLAVIGDSGNAASVGIHHALGFEHIGTMRSVGWKMSAWRDVVMMQRALGLGDDGAPWTGS
jgi:L-amino acid N-acyltransferase YncA